MAFCCFEAFFGEIHMELFVLDIKVTISEMSTEILRKFCFFYHFWKGANTEENLDLFKQLYLIKSVKEDKCKQKLFLSRK